MCLFMNPYLLLHGSSEALSGVHVISSASAQRYNAESLKDLPYFSKYFFMPVNFVTDLLISS